MLCENVILGELDTVAKNVHNSSNVDNIYFLCSLCDFIRNSNVYKI